MAMTMPKDFNRNARPPFLFRAASDESRGVNTTDKIDPLGGYQPDYHADVDSIGIPELRGMIWSHLNYKYRTPSEFSSWSISLLWVLVHAVRKAYDKGEDDILIYVMDTKTLPASRIHSAAKLVEDHNIALDGQGNGERYCVGEYLVHGKLTNACGLWKTVNLDELLANDLLHALPGLKSPKRGSLLHQRILQLRKRYFSDLWPMPLKPVMDTIKKLARCFGAKWDGMILISLVACYRHEMTPENVAVIRLELGDTQLLPLSWDSDQDLRDFRHVAKDVPEASQLMSFLQLLYDRERQAADGGVGSEGQVATLHEDSETESEPEPE